MENQKRKGRVPRFLPLEMIFSAAEACVLVRCGTLQDEARSRRKKGEGRSSRTVVYSRGQRERERERQRYANRGFTFDIESQGARDSKGLLPPTFAIYPRN